MSWDSETDRFCETESKYEYRVKRRQVSMEFRRLYGPLVMSKHTDFRVFGTPTWNDYHIGDMLSRTKFFGYSLMRGRHTTFIVG